MSDLAATNCGCGCEGNNGISCIWLILLLALCGGNGTALSNNGGCGLSGDNCCLIILLLLFCGGCGSSLLSGNGNGCGCGC
jgi:hypothetical protein